MLVWHMHCWLDIKQGKIYYALSFLIETADFTSLASPLTWCMHLHLQLRHPIEAHWNRPCIIWAWNKQNLQISADFGLITSFCGWKCWNFKCKLQKMNGHKGTPDQPKYLALWWLTVILPFRYPWEGCPKLLQKLFRYTNTALMYSFLLCLPSRIAIYWWWVH